MRNPVYYIVLDRLMRQEYAMARMLGCSGVEAALHVLRLVDDFRSMCQCMTIDRAGR